MFSDLIKSTLEREVVGQPWAVNSVVRGVTRVASGLTPRERTLCAYMFIGPSGTGKTHLVRGLALALHGDENRMVVADCAHLSAGDPWTTFSAQLAPLFLAGPSGWGGSCTLEPPPLSLIRIENFERAPSEVRGMLAMALETARLPLPEGRRGSLSDCLIFLISTLCSREILDDAYPIGFTGSLDEDEGTGQERIYRLCRELAEKQFGSDFLAQLDALIVFRKLEQRHLADILERRIERLGRWLAARGFRCEMSQAAKRFLLERSARDLRLGATDLVRAHQRFVEFPLADLLISGRIPAGGKVYVDRRDDEDQLHFTTLHAGSFPLPASSGREVPVVWGQVPRSP